MKFLDEKVARSPGHALRELLRSGQLTLGGGAHDALSARIVEGIVQVLWSGSGGVMEKHALNAGGPLENRANKSSPYPHSRVEGRPNWLTHPERLSHCSESVGASWGG